MRTTNKYLLGPDVQMGRTLRFSTGIDQTISPKVRLNASFQSVRGVNQLRGENLNAPVNGVRPDPGFANIIQTVSDAELGSDQLSTTLNVNFAGGVRNAGTALWNPRRTTLRLAYWIARANNNFDGPFVVPPGGSLDTEWAPSPDDRRHRYAIAINSQALRNLNASVTLAGNTGTPYNITTGFDDNNDSLFNDRPAGVGRNSVRTSSQATVSANLSYSIGVGGSATATRGTGGGPRRRPHRPGGGTLPAGVHGRRQQPDEPDEFCRVQRDPDVTVLPDAHRRPEPPQGGHRRRSALLVPSLTARPHEWSMRSQVSSQMDSGPRDGTTD